MTTQEERPLERLARRVDGWPTMFSRDLPDSLAARSNPTHSLATELARRAARTSQSPTRWIDPLLKWPVVVTGQHEATNLGQAPTDLAGPQPDTATPAPPTVRARPVPARPVRALPLEPGASTVAGSTGVEPIVFQARDGKTEANPTPVRGLRARLVRVGTTAPATVHAGSEEGASTNPHWSPKNGPPTQIPTRTATATRTSLPLPVILPADVALQEMAAPQSLTVPDAAPAPVDGLASTQQHVGPLEPVVPKPLIPSKATTASTVPATDARRLLVVAPNPMSASSPSPNRPATPIVAPRVPPPVRADGVELIFATPTEVPVETSGHSPTTADLAAMDTARHARPQLPTVEAPRRPPVNNARLVDDVYDLIVGRLRDERARRGW